MERTTKPKSKLSSQIKRNSKTEKKENDSEELRGNDSLVVSTGSTLLDLAISGTRVYGGGLFGGTVVEIFGPNGAGKTVLLSEIAGAVLRNSGEVMFHDPEARLNKQFASIFDLDMDKITYTTPDTVTDVFKQIQKWQPSDTSIVNGVFTDSLAALSTNLEMTNEEGDKLGQRRAKEFSEGLRKSARVIKDRNLLFVCSNQIRQKMDAGPYSEKYDTPGGEAFKFYASLRLQAKKVEKIYKETNIGKVKEKRAIGIETTIYVYKSSLDKPYRSAPVVILFDYGIDDIRANLQWLKKYTGASTYCIGDYKLAQSLEESISIVEEKGLEKRLKREVIRVWQSVEKKFQSNRKPKQR